MEGRITRSRRYVTPAPAHLNTFDDHVTDFVMPSEGPLVRSHRVKKPSSRFLHVEEESQRTSAQVLRSIKAQRRQADVQLEYKQQLNADLVAEKDIHAKATEQFLIWKIEEEEKGFQKAMETSTILFDQKRHIEVSEVALNEMKKRLKTTQSLCDYYKNVSRRNVTKSSDGTEIEMALSKVLPGKHASTKAKALFHEIVSGRLYNGAAMTVLNGYMHSYIKKLFAPWRLLKASDVSVIGAFKSLTA
jgi:hypothetical protein